MTRDPLATRKHAVAADPGTAVPPKASQGFRGDVEGLRAIAVGLVLIYHAGVPAVTGGFIGVDIFFVISGFLITSLLIRELDRTGTVSLITFYARRAKRLLPATAVVLVVTAALVLTLVPRIRWSDIGGDIVASSVYLVNWRFASQSVDYLAEGSGASPVQHFWSLAVEEQFYLVWPALLLLVTLVARRRGRSIRPALWFGVLVVAVPSLLWSIQQTQASPESAFFVTTTRMWELAIGAAIAIGAPTLARIPRALAAALGWGGLAVVLVSAFLITAQSAWPGYLAAFPTLATGAVIIAGLVDGARGPAGILSVAPMRWVGGLSYSLYLWHWPLLIVATAVWGELSVVVGLVIVVFSVVPSLLTQKFVENPLRYSRTVSSLPKYALSVGANCSLIGVVAGLIVVLAMPASTQPTAAETPRESRGASALTVEDIEQPLLDSSQTVGSIDDLVAQESVGDDEVFPASAEGVVPDPLYATDDVPVLYDDGCQVEHAVSEVVVCTYGVEEPETTIALVGDSKAAQWLPALQSVAEEKDWGIITMTKSACGFHSGVVTTDGRNYQECAEWNEAVLEELETRAPDVVLTSQLRDTAALDADSEPSQEGMVEALQRSWERAADLGIPVIALTDTPQPGFEVYECVSENVEELSACTFDWAPTDTMSNAVLATAAEAVDVPIIDLNPLVCPQTPCWPVIGDVLVYRQGSHITATYAETTGPHLARALEQAIEQTEEER